MVAHFPKTLSQLRQEKGVSQRSAASALGVSQALLSHYENGAREPGLDFLLRAATFYNVSVDELLGYTPAPATDASSAGVAGETASSLALQRSKMLDECIVTLFDILAASKNRALVDSASQYLTLAVYKVLRYLYTANSNEESVLFTIPQSSFSELSDARMKRLELDMKLDAISYGENGAKDGVFNSTILSDSIASLLRLAREQLSESNLQKNKK